MFSSDNEVRLPAQQNIQQNFVPQMNALARGRGRRRQPAEDGSIYHTVAHGIALTAIVGWDVIEPIARPLLEGLGEVFGRMNSFRVISGLAYGGYLLLENTRTQQLVARWSPWGPSKKAMENGLKVFREMSGVQANQVILQLYNLASQDPNLDSKPAISKPAADGSVSISYGSTKSQRLTLDAIVLLKALPILVSIIRKDRTQREFADMYAPIISWLDDGEFERIDSYRQDNNRFTCALNGVQGYDDLLEQVAQEAMDTFSREIKSTQQQSSASSLSSRSLTSDRKQKTRSSKKVVEREKAALIRERELLELRKQVEQLKREQEPEVGLNLGEGGHED